jgi:two-component system, NarL family, response regulator NreC
MPIKVLLADDHLIVRQGLRAILEREGFEVVGEAADGRRAIELARELRPDVAILDYSMPLLNGIDAAREIITGGSGTKVVLLTMHTEDQYILEAIKAGIRGLTMKSQASEDLVRAIREVHRGGTYLCPGVSQTVVQAYLRKTDLPSDPLSARERQVLQLVAEGKSTKEIAALLGISFKTVESHRARIMEKLGLHETASLVRYAIRQGLIQP